MTSRRGVVKVVLFLGAAGVVMARPWTWGRTEQIAFRPLDAAPPFRHLAMASARISGGGSAANAALIGLTVPGQGPDAELRDRMRGEVARRLLADWRPDGPVPITYFTDIQCPLCPGFEAELLALAAESGSVPQARELPLFPGSERFAQLVVAADLQGPAMGAALREVLRSSRGAVSESRLRQVEGLDVDALVTMADGDRVAAHLAEDRAIAHVLEIPGTPSAVIGRTIIVGRVPAPTLRDVLTREAAEGPPDMG